MKKIILILTFISFVTTAFATASENGNSCCMNKKSKCEEHKQVKSNGPVKHSKNGNCSNCGVCCLYALLSSTTFQIPIINFKIGLIRPIDKRNFFPGEILRPPIS